MLAYAYQSLNISDVNRYSSEDFDYVDDLFSVILAKGVAKQIKIGLGKGYVIEQEQRKTPRGKICLAETFRSKAHNSNDIYCQVDNYIEDTYMNRILKTTILLLLHSKDVALENKRKLKKVLVYFSNISELDYKNISWRGITFDRNNSSYRMLMNICYLIIEGMLMSESDTNELKLNRFIDDQRMSALYERFILSYYRRHYPHFKVTQSHIPWDSDDNMIDLLPQMKSDIMIEYQGKTLIIDAKYYQESLKTNSLYGNKTIHSNNLYQIFAYVKNKDTAHDGSVTGMLLYANTEGDNPDAEYQLSGNKISVKTLDLNCDFMKVKNQLDEIVKVWLTESVC